jgi:signal transduction histidine kinase
MNRFLLRIAGPSLAIGLLLLGTCLASVWYINHLQRDLAKILSENVTSQRAAQNLEIRLRQLRFHGFLYLIDPEPRRLRVMQDDQEKVEKALAVAKRSVYTPEERACVQRIEADYKQYHDEMARLEADVTRAGPPRSDLGRLADAHPIRPVAEACEQWLQVNREAMERTAEESNQVGKQARWAMVLLGVLGPASGLIMGYGIARGLSRSIYQLSVRVQDMAQRLDHDVASVTVAAEGDIKGLDRQLQHVVARVEEVGERLQRHQREMLRAEQLSAVGQLAAGVAHEVRNPLTSVKLLVEAALRDQNRKPLSVEDLRVIHGEVARLEHTVQDFLDFARPPALQRTLCDLRDVVTQATELVRARARQQEVRLELRCPESPVQGYVDRGQLCTVLVNLFINALDAMPRGGCLEVSLDESPDTAVRLQVADTGPGIPSAMTGRLFTPFASTKPTGTGLGLSICRRILEEHDGSISAANRAEGGACFTISLPGLPVEERHAHPVAH